MSDELCAMYVFFALNTVYHILVGDDYLGLCISREIRLHLCSTRVWFLWDNVPPGVPDDHDFFRSQPLYLPHQRVYCHGEERPTRNT